VTGAPSGPKVREWGKPQQSAPSTQAPQAQGFGKGAQGYSKPVGFIKAGDSNVGRDGSEVERPGPGRTTKTDEELEAERKEARKKDEEISFKDVRSPC
jgi:RNA-binding protein 25